MKLLCAEQYRRLCDDVAEQALRCGQFPSAIDIIAVTKMQPASVVPALYAAGCRDFGESRVQEFLPKKSAFHETCRWHFIGPLQKNKVIKVIGQCALIHSVDSVSLAQKIDEVSGRIGCHTDVLIEVNTSQEASKHGFTSEELLVVFESLAFLPHLSIKGLMTMAPAESSAHVTAACFSCLRRLRDHLAASYALPLHILSMGMSGDYPIAIQEGATLLRIGSLLYTG